MTQTEWIAKLEYLAKTSKDLTGDCLLVLEELLESCLFACQHPSFMGNPFGPEILAEIREAQRRRAIKETVRYLRRKEYLKQQKKGSKVLENLTNSGKLRSLEKRMRQKTELLPENIYCIVVFDIPEATRVSRWHIRNKLRSLGFTKHQLSVWKTKKNLCDEITTYVQLIGASEWVSVLEARIKG